MLALAWPISFDRPEWLWLLLTIPVIVAVSLRWLTGIERHRRMIAVTLRSVVIALLATALARVECVQRNKHVAAMFVLDRSRSIPEDQRLAAQAYVREIAREAPMDHRVGVIGFDGDADVDLMPSRTPLDVFGFSMADEADRTNIAAGMRMAMAAFPEGYARRMVVLTDGNQNIGDMIEEIEVASASQVAIDVIPLQYNYDNEILFDRIVVPSHASRDTQVPVRLVVKSQQRTMGRLSIYHNDVKVPLSDSVVRLTGDMKPDPFTIPIEVHTGGVHRFDARITPLNERSDSIPENNRATAFTFVEDKGRVLILSAAGSDDDRVLYIALKREKIDVELKGVDQLAVDLLALQQYGAVILANISADTFTAEQHRALASYVRDFGGGLIMTGGNEAFGAGGWIGSPVEEVSPVSFEIKHKRLIPRGALAIIMHSCEAPKGNYWGEQAAIAAVKAISSRDYLGVIAYTWTKRGPNWEVPLAPATNKPAIIQAFKKMQIGDMPDFGTTMNIAVRDLMKLPDASQRHIIIISDGDPSPPSARTIQYMVDKKITCSTVAIGYGGAHVMEQSLRAIARKTKGRFYALKNPRRLPQIFVKEAKVIKRALIDDRPFQPRMAYHDALTTLGITDIELPSLGGLVLTQIKPDALTPVVRLGTFTGESTEDPVLAYWNFEMGKMAVFTSGWWPKWGADWSAWEKFGKFWAQLVRWAMRESSSANFDIITRLQGNQGHVVIEALNKDASYLNFLRIHGRLLTPGNERQPLHLTQTGPGTYEATFDVNDQGNYLVLLQYDGGEDQSGLIRTGLSVPYSPEFRELDTNVTLLIKAAQQTGGRRLLMDPQQDKVFALESLPPAVSRQPVWRWVVTWLLLPVFLLDVAGRRLASVVAMSVYVEAAVLVVICAILHSCGTSTWGFVGALVLAEVVGWSLRWRSIGPVIQFFTSGVTAAARASQRSAQSLARLKGVREKIREEFEEPSATAEKPTTIPLEPQADRKARFDVGDEEAAKPAGDLTETLGGAAAVDDREESARPRRATDEAQSKPGDLAARLRKAKQRAKDEMEDRGNSN